jgi:tRNA (cmo5U34)-methyltransferase
MTVEQAFNQTVAYYDNWMKKALPRYDAIFSSALELIPFGEEDTLQVLDLGAGTGLFSQLVFSKYPRAKFLLVDLAQKMLGIAKERFGNFPDQFVFELNDIRDLQDERKYDLVISSLSIHHLADSDKKKLFKQVYRSLNDTGIFINVDQVKGPTPAVEDLYKEDWLKRVREKGAEEEQIQSSVQRRATYDRDALMSDQLQWLSDAGFKHVDCVFKDYFIGVFYAKKA